MKLIICEKPNLAKKVATAMVKQDHIQRKNGYYEGNTYIVSNAYGHLFGLFDIEDYTGEKRGKWSIEALPFVPESFRFRLKRNKNGDTDPGIQQQFKLLEELMNREDVDEIVHCGDADREGEVIIRLIIQEGLKTSKKISRLWLPEQTEESIREALANLPDDSDYDALYQEGLARTYIDWLYGINGTRYISVKANGMLRFGRVLCAIVKAIYDRELEIENFKPRKYYKAESNVEVGGIIVKLTGAKEYELDQSDDAKKYCSMLNSNAAIVKHVESKRMKRSAGRLYSLSKLQGVMGKKYKLSPSKTLEALQSLYEKGFVTYPRTNTEFLAEAEKMKMQQIIGILQAKGIEVVQKESKRIYDDSKIESHSALTLTKQMPNMDELNTDEQKVYQTIANRFMAVFCAEDHVVEQTKVVISCGDEEFQLTGEVIVQDGYLKFEPLTGDKKQLPSLKSGDQIPIDFQVVEKETTPPKRYTVESLNAYLEHPFRKAGPRDIEDEYQAMHEGIEIGTVGTRAGIIDNAISNQYISLKNNTYYLEPNGKYLNELLEELEIDMTAEATVALSKRLKQVYHGTIGIDEAVELTKQELKRLVMK